MKSIKTPCAREHSATEASGGERRAPGSARLFHPPTPCTHEMGTRPRRGLFPWVSLRRTPCAWERPAISPIHHYTRPAPGSLTHCGCGAMGAPTDPFPVGMRQDVSLLHFTRPPRGRRDGRFSHRSASAANAAMRPIASCGNNGLPGHASAKKKSARKRFH